MAHPLALPVQPTVAPMLAEVTRDLPSGDGWLYEPKWDGFRALVFWDGDELVLQSRDLRPLNRYFPELEAGLRQALPAACVLDGEVVVAGPKGLDFEALQQRIHPPPRRIQLQDDRATPPGRGPGAVPRPERLRSRPHARRAESLDGRSRHQLGAAAAGAGVRGGLRSPAGRALPPRGDLPALEVRQATPRLHLRP